MTDEQILTVLQSLIGYTDDLDMMSGRDIAHDVQIIRTLVTPIGTKVVSNGTR